jgi:uncharacterized SAM-binding protein YcdF (DUF218 family)
MNQTFMLLGIEAWKPVLTALLLPPLPLLVLTLLGAMLMRSRAAAGWSVILGAVGALWLCSCMAGAEGLNALLLPQVPAFGTVQVERLKIAVAAGRPVAIVVLGGGRDELAPEYGTSSLSANSLERLRYALWLARKTGAPVAFSGGAGHAEPGAAPEAEVAARVAAEEFGQRLRWIETESRDTRENAARSMVLLGADGIGEIVLVTQAWHMPRALRAFGEAAARSGRTVRLQAAPVGLAARSPPSVTRWLPSTEGFKLTRDVLREKIGWWAGA